MNYLATGFMRSGTSAFMQGLAAGGLKILASEGRDGFNIAYSDKSYMPNPESLFEINQDDLTKELLSKNPNAALKVVAPQIDSLPVSEYKVVILRRDSEEIRQSLDAAFNIKRTIEFIESSINHLIETLYNRKDVKEIIEIDHQDLMFKPKEVFKNLNWPINYKKAASVIDPELYRFRKNKLVVGL